MQVTILSKSRGTDVSTTATSMLNDFSKRDFSADTFMMAQIATLRSNNNLLTGALNEKAVIATLGPIDEKRDNALRVIFMSSMPRSCGTMRPSAVQPHVWP